MSAIVDNPPSSYIFKDAITAFIYIFHLIKIISSGVKDINTIKDDKSNMVYFIYIPTTFAKELMSLAMIFRIIGMFIQYMGITVDRQCFVESNNMLQQTPFEKGCLSWCDWLILLLIGLTLISAILPAIYGPVFIFIVICDLNLNNFLFRCSCCKRKYSEDVESALPLTSPTLMTSSL